MNPMKIQNKILSYSELIKLDSYAERLNYLKLEGGIGRATFGIDRYLNQAFYKSAEWSQVRDYIIVRDSGCDLGVPGLPITGSILVHHMNPLELSDITDATDVLFNPEYLITVSHATHNAIHYGVGIELTEPAKRTKFDTCPWRKEDG